jgi:hypothetical protein
MAYEVKGLLTSEITTQQLQSLQQGFNTFFKKNYSIDYFQKKYTNTHLGFSFHGVLFFQQQVVGSFSVIPRLYNAGGKQVLLGVACDAFILEEHRKDELFLKKMHQAVEEQLKNYNISFIFSIPNDIAYPYWKYMVRYKDIGLLHYYVLPIKVGAIKPALKLFDMASAILAKLWVSLQPANDQLLYEEAADIFLIRDEKHYLYRYSFADYKEIDTKTYKARYRVYDENGINVAYLVDVFPTTAKNLKLAMSSIMKQEKQNCHLIMFIGNLSKTAAGLIKLPVSKEPRKQRVIGWSSNPEQDKDFFKIGKLQISLADFDNR